MKHTFVEYKCDDDTEWKNVYTVHKTVTIGLLLGSHDIPTGFILEAACGKEQETKRVELGEPDDSYHDLVKCEVCWK